MDAELIDRLLNNPGLGRAASEVADEIATLPRPADLVPKITGLAWTSQGCTPWRALIPWADVWRVAGEMARVSPVRSSTWRGDGRTPATAAEAAHAGAAPVAWMRKPRLNAKSQEARSMDQHKQDPDSLLNNAGITLI